MHRFYFLKIFITFASNLTTFKNQYYDGKRSVNYRKGGIDVPGLSEMYTHCVGGYYFNPTDARKQHPSLRRRTALWREVRRLISGGF